MYCISTDKIKQNKRFTENIVVQFKIQAIFESV